MSLIEPGPGLDTDLGTIDEVQTEQGHMGVEGELHYDLRCRYVRYVKTMRMDHDNGRDHITVYTLRRVCKCSVEEEEGLYPGMIRSEMHFSNKCKWKRIKDTALSTHNQNVYLFRKCYCFQPGPEYKLPENRR